MEKIISYFYPRDIDLTETGNVYEIKNSRLYILYSIIVYTIVFIFTILNYISNKKTAAYIDFYASFFYLYFLFVYKKKGTYDFSVSGFFITSEIIISLQHYFAPNNMASNIIWLPLLIMLSLYLLPPKKAFYISLFGIILLLIAETLPLWFSYVPDTYSPSDDMTYNFSSILLAGIGAYLIARVWVKEESNINMKFEQQNNLLFELNQRNYSLLALIGHDLSNHISLCDGYSQKLEKKINEEESLLIVNKLTSTLAKVKDIIINVKQLGSLEMGKTNLIIKPVSILKSIDDSLELVENKIKSKNIRVKYNRESLLDKNILVMADEVSLSSSVISNLLTNAIKFSNSSDEIEIHVTYSETEVFLSVKDNGIGIPAEIMPHLFNMKKRTSRLGTSGEAGTGFGLPLLKMFLTKYGATIDVETKCFTNSFQDHGTIFKITLKRFVENN